MADSVDAGTHEMLKELLWRIERLDEIIEEAVDTRQSDDFQQPFTV